MGCQSSFSSSSSLPREDGRPWGMWLFSGWYFVATILFHGKPVLTAAETQLGFPTCRRVINLKKWKIIKFPRAFDRKMHNVPAAESHNLSVIWECEGHSVPPLTFLKDILTLKQRKHILLRYTQLFSKMYLGAWQVLKRLKATYLDLFSRILAFYLTCLFRLPSSIFLLD